MQVPLTIVVIATAFGAGGKGMNGDDDGSTS
jgi:hypothetical protein